jgi:hypothetical protein
MTPEEYRAALTRLGLSVVGAGKLFGVNPRTSQRWAAGEQDIPRAVMIALTLMVRYRVHPERFWPKD